MCFVLAGDLALPEGLTIHIRGSAESAHAEQHYSMEKEALAFTEGK